MKYWMIILLLTLTSRVYMQECPPADTLSVSPIQDLWNIPMENQWNRIEVMTWNIKQFPLSNNTIEYVNEIISDILPDIIAFQEINDGSAFNILANSIPAYEFISSGSGLALAARSDVIEIASWTTLFSGAGYDFAWRYPLLVELNWLCGTTAESLKIINIHLKSGSTNDDFERRYSSCEYLSEYVNDNLEDNIIILGDYNDEITNSQNNNSLWPLVSDVVVAFATEPIVNIDYYASYPSWPSFIDHIALSTSLFDELDMGNIKTIRIDDYTGYSNFQNNISDHRPVLWSFPVTEIALSEGLVINEIMRNPSIVSDAAGEWIEITNISYNDISLNGLIIRDNDDEEHVISDNSLIVVPGGFIVLGINNDPSLNGEVTIDYTYNDFTLSNLWDEVIIEHPSGVILDEVHYDNDATFPDESGKSMMLLDPTLDNNLGENWADADIIFGSGDYGTPGSNNFSEACGESPGDMNGDGVYNVLDVVSLVNCVLANNCQENECNGDLNNDGIYNVLDIVSLVNCVLVETCGE